MMNGFKGRSRGWKEIEIKIEREETYQPRGSGSYTYAMNQEVKDP